MNQFFESKIVPSSNADKFTAPEDQTTYKMADERLDRRERAEQAARKALRGRRS